VRRGREAGDVPDLDQQPRRALWPHAGQRHQGAAGRLDQLLECLVSGLLPAVDPLRVTDELGGDSAASFPAVRDDAHEREHVDCQHAVGWDPSRDAPFRRERTHHEADLGGCA
jgi:hypothetical protein